MSLSSKHKHDNETPRSFYLSPGIVLYVVVIRHYQKQELAHFRRLANLSSYSVLNQKNCLLTQSGYDRPLYILSNSSSDLSSALYREYNRHHGL